MPTKSKNYGKLGKSITQNILKYLDFIHLYRFRQVCRHFVDAADDIYPGLTSVDLSALHKTMDNNILESIADFCGIYIEHLSLRGCWKLTDEAYEIICSKMPNIRTLNAESVWNTTVAGITHIQSMERSKIVSINLSNCKKVTDEGIGMILDSCPLIENLELSYCKNLTGSTFQHERWRQIKVLNLLRCTAIRDPAFAMWYSETVGQPPSTDLDMEVRPTYQMKELNLSDCSFLTDKAILHLSLSCPALEALYLSFCCTLSPDAIKVITENCENLTTLDVSYCGTAVTDSGLSQISDSMINLERLSLRGMCRINQN